MMFPVHWDPGWLSLLGKWRQGSSMELEHLTTLEGPGGGGDQNQPFQHRTGWCS